MKQTYQIPTLKQLSLDTEEMVATSFVVSDKETDTQWSKENYEDYDEGVSSKSVWD